MNFLFNFHLSRGTTNFLLAHLKNHLRPISNFQLGNKKSHRKNALSRGKKKEHRAVFSTSPHRKTPGEPKRGNVGPLAVGTRGPAVAGLSAIPPIAPSSRFGNGGTPGLGRSATVQLANGHQSRAGARFNVPTSISHSSLPPRRCGPTPLSVTRANSHGLSRLFDRLDGAAIALEDRGGLLLPMVALLRSPTTSSTGPPEQAHRSNSPPRLLRLRSGVQQRTGRAAAGFHCAGSTYSVCGAVLARQGARLTAGYGHEAGTRANQLRQSHQGRTYSVLPLVTVRASGHA